MALLLLTLALLIGLTLGAVGGGGSILAVPVLVGVAGLAVTEATTASLIVVGTSATIGLVSDLRSGRVRVAPGIVFGLTGIGGATLGTMLNRNLADGPLLIAFAGLMALVAAKMAHGLLTSGAAPSASPALPPTAGAPQDPARPRTGERGAATLGRTSRRSGVVDTRECGKVTGIDTCAVVRILLAGTAVGFLTGLFGVGGGFVIVPALILVLGFDVFSAAATSLLVIAINSAVALVLRADFGNVDWALVGPFTLLATAGVLIGRRVASRVPARSLTIALTVLIVAMAAWTAMQGVAAL